MNQDDISRARFWRDLQRFAQLQVDVGRRGMIEVDASLASTLGLTVVNVTLGHRRQQIRRAARARKSRRGWR